MSFVEVVMMIQEIVHTCNGVGLGSEMAVYTLHHADIELCRYSS